MGEMEIEEEKEEKVVSTLWKLLLTFQARSSSSSPGLQGYSLSRSRHHQPRWLAKVTSLEVKLFDQIKLLANGQLEAWWWRWWRTTKVNSLLLLYFEQKLPLFTSTWDESTHDVSATALLLLLLPCRLYRSLEIVTRRWSSCQLPATGTTMDSCLPHTVWCWLVQAVHSGGSVFNSTYSHLTSWHLTRNISQLQLFTVLFCSQKQRALHLMHKLINAQINDNLGNIFALNGDKKQLQ